MKNSIVSPELFRYFLASVLALIADYFVLIFLVSVVGFHYILGAVAGFVFGSAFVYYMSTSWVFDSRRLNNRVHEFSVFFSVGFVALVVGVCIIWFFTEIVGFHYILSKLISTGAVFLFNFFVRRLLLFRVKNA